MNSDTPLSISAIKVPPLGSVSPATAVLAERRGGSSRVLSAETLVAQSKCSEGSQSRQTHSNQAKSAAKGDPMAPYDFDNYHGRLYLNIRGNSA